MHVPAHVALRIRTQKGSNHLPRGQQDGQTLKYVKAEDSKEQDQKRPVDKKVNSTHGAKLDR